MFDRGQEVANVFVSLVSVGSLFDDGNALCDIDDLSMSNFHGNPICWEIK